MIHVMDSSVLLAVAKGEPNIAWHVKTEAVRRDRGPHGVEVELSDGEALMTGPSKIVARGTVLL